MVSKTVALACLPWRVSKGKELTPEEKGINPDSAMGFEHVGLLYLKTLLEDEGIDTTSHDFSFDAFHGRRKSPNACVEEILRNGPSVVGFSPYFTSITDTLCAAEKVKKKSPRTKVVLGGSHASHNANEILEDNPFIDAIFLGEAFGTIGPGIEALVGDKELGDLQGIAFRNGGKIINTGWGEKVDLDLLPIPRRSKDLYELTKTASIMPAVGCPAACTFCSAEALRDRSWRSRSSESIAEEIRYLEREFGISTIETHCDDSFGPANQAIPNYGGLAQKLISDNCNVRWRSVLRTTDFGERGKLLNKDFWRLLHESGLERVFIGFEGGTDKRLRKLRKPSTVENNKRAFEFLTNSGIAVQYGFIMFFPDSTLEEVRQNHDFLYGLGQTSFCNYGSSLIILPGSEYFRRYKEEGKLRRPYYGSQPYEFSDQGVGKICRAYGGFVRDQQPLDALCNDLGFARTRGCSEIVCQGAALKIRKEFLEERAKHLYLTGTRVLDNPEKASEILGEFNQKWRERYQLYLKQNATHTQSPK